MYGHALYPWSYSVFSALDPRHSLDILKENYIRDTWGNTYIRKNRIDQSHRRLEENKETK